MEKTQYWEELQQDLVRTYELDLPGMLTEEQLEALLATKLNALIRDDFNSLILLLYRIDVDEKKLRQLLLEGTGEDAGMIIARLIIERQLKKIETRRQYRNPDAGSGWKDI